MDKWKDLVGAELAGYRLERYLAHGGQAAVFVGVNPLRPDEARRAIKVVDPLPALDESFKERFVEEAQALEGLSHDNIVKFLDVRFAPAMRGREALRDGRPLIALELELLEGRTLEKVAESEQLPKVEDVLNWCAQACDGLSAAHAKGIIHRDVKPSNIFVCNDGVVKLIDFGIARAFRRADEDSKGRLSKDEKTAGTPLYLAPELWGDGKVTIQADLYALGLTLAQVLLGRHPFFGVDRRVPNNQQVILAHQDGDLRAKLTQPNLRLSLPVEELILLLCARDPNLRPATAAVAAAAIRAVRDTLLRERAQTIHGNITQVPRQDHPAWPFVTQTYFRTAGLPLTAIGVKSPGARMRASLLSKGTWIALGILVGAVSLTVVGVYVVRAVTNHDTATPKQELEMIDSGPASEIANVVLASPRASDPPVGMVLVPAGTFLMGRASGGEDDERPVQRVMLSSYYLDRTEVSVAAYRECVRARSCAEPSTEDTSAKSELERSLLSAYCNWEAGRDDHPMNCVNWDDSVGYCHWLGKRLPTEAEWEYASRGSGGGIYPWGDDQPSSERGNYLAGDYSREAAMRGLSFTDLMHEGWDGWEGTAPVGSFPRGRSSFGVDDTSGNVWELVSDWYRPYTGGDLRNPLGPSRGTLRVLRGGSWRESETINVSSTQREGISPLERASDVGFRCARGVDARIASVGALATGDATTLGPQDRNPFVELQPARGRLVMGLPRDAPETWLGWPYSDDHAQQLVAPMEPFRLHAHEVTWGELRGWNGQTAAQHDQPGLDADLPVTGVSWEEARAYCRALDCPGVGCDLPTEAQWEYAARGPELRPLPWGTSGSPLDAHVYQGRNAQPYAVTEETADSTPHDPAIRDLLGNVREWTLDPFREPPGEPTPDTAGGRRWYVLRGLPLMGGEPTTQGDAIAYRVSGCAGNCPPSPLQAETGFRCASPPLPLEPAPVAEPVSAGTPRAAAAHNFGCAMISGAPAHASVWWLTALAFTRASAKRRRWRNAL